jgi:hypothetical protein
MSGKNIYINGSNESMWQGNFSITRYFFIVGLFLALLFTSLEPKGSEGLGKLISLPFWCIHMLIALSILIYLQKLSFRLEILKNRPWHLLTLNGCVGALIFSIPAHFLDYFFGMQGNSNPSIFSSDFVNEVGGVFIPVASTWILINAPWLLQLNFKSKNQDLTSSSSTQILPKETGLNDKKNILCSSIIKHEVIAISSELHYLRIYTSTKQHLILGALKDAIKEFPENSGIQTHRSHWVSKKYVKSLKDIESGTACIMQNELIIPVSRRKKSEILSALRNKI